jgi:hypothetical protein
MGRWLGYLAQGYVAAAWLVCVPLALICVGIVAGALWLVKQATR